MSTKVGNQNSKQINTVRPHSVRTATDSGEKLRTCRDMHNLIICSSWFSHDVHGSMEIIRLTTLLLVKGTDS